MNRNFYLLIISTTIFLQSCYTGVVPLKGKYQNAPVSSEIKASTDDVWQSIVDYISEKRLPVKIIDKPSGFVIFEKYSFAGKMSVEDKDGKLISPEAYVAVDRPKGDFPDKNINFKAVGSWDIRLKKISDGISNVIVNLDSISVGTKLQKLSGYSTGNLEREVISFIKSQSEK